MAEEIPGGEESGPLNRIRALVPPAVLEWPHLTVVSLCVFFAAITFILYWYLGPQSTAFPHHVNQAYAVLHGHLDIRPEQAVNFNTLEKAIYDGRYYLQWPAGPAIILLPGVVVWGLELNETLVSVVLAALTAPLVFLVVRSQVMRLNAQVWLTVLFMFGTMFWWLASDGGAWFFAQTAATLFMFGALYAALVRKDLFLTGACVGAAYLCRQSVILAYPFFLIMLMDNLVPPDWRSKPLLQKVQWEPLLRLGSGTAIFLAFSFVWNFARFDNPLESGYSYSEQVHQEGLKWLYNHGLFHPSYLQRHPPIVFEGMPIFSDSGSYLWPSRAGQAIWATTPAFMAALFVGIKDRRVIIAGAVGLAVMALVTITRPAAGVWLDWDWWARQDFNWGWRVLPGLHMWPLYFMIALAIASAVRTRDKLAIACWAAIVPIALTNFSFAANGYSQYGYRYAVDFYPFLFLLVVHAARDRLHWSLMALIGVSVLINIWAVLWIHQFELHHTWGWTWFSF